jgi:hypothetical protein
MQNEKKEKFVWSDAWLMLAIALTDNGEGAALSTIIGAGDYINHSILTGPEIRHGLEFFIRAGYVIEKGGGFKLSGEAKRFWQEYRKTHKSIYKSLDGFMVFLRVNPNENLKREDEYHDWQYPALTDEMVHQAFLDYQEGSSK